MSGVRVLVGTHKGAFVLMSDGNRKNWEASGPPVLASSRPPPPDGKLRVYRSRSGGNEWEALTKGLPQKDCYVNVLRDAMSVDTLDPCGIYFGTPGGEGAAPGGTGGSWGPRAPRPPGSPWRGWAGR